MPVRWPTRSSSNLPILSALTLALGLGVIDALESLGVTGVQLKWPNDLVAADGKLGGILTETQARQRSAKSGRYGRLGST